jgi:hypothetical protein
MYCARVVCAVGYPHRIGWRSPIKMEVSGIDDCRWRIRKGGKLSQKIATGLLGF